jgi:hypothetical protein
MAERKTVAGPCFAKRGYEFSDDSQVALVRRRAQCPVKQFMIADGREENGGGTVLREMGEHPGSPLHEMKAGVGIEQEHQNWTSRCSPWGGTFKAVVQPAGGERVQIALRPAILVGQGTENESLAPAFDLDPFRVDPQRFGDADGLRATRGEDACFHFRIYVYPETGSSKEKTRVSGVPFPASRPKGSRAFPGWRGGGRCGLGSGEG